MADKELRKMNRTELIEIIYALQQNEKALREENGDLRRKLDDRRIRMEKAGSIAEAALSLNHVFEDAQNAAEQYCQSIADAGAQAEQILADARAQAEVILAGAERQRQQAQAECESMTANTTRQLKEKTDAFNRELRRILTQYPELKEHIRLQRQGGGNGA